MGKAALALRDKGSLCVGYLGDTLKVEQSRSLTFGRHAELSIDNNPYMHRLVGRLECRDGRWWLCNVGNAISLEVIDAHGSSSAVVAPGADQALPARESKIRFLAGSKAYELKTSTSDFTDIEPHPASDTICGTDIPITDSQRLLILALAEPRLRSPFDRLTVPPTKQAARRLGWTTTKFNRKLDTVCAKLTSAGFDGLKGGTATVATDRRRNLVELSVQAGIIEASMLPLLEEIDR